MTTWDFFPQRGSILEGCYYFQPMRYAEVSFCKSIGTLGNETYQCYFLASHDHHLIQVQIFLAGLKLFPTSVSDYVHHFSWSGLEMTSVTSQITSITFGHTEETNGETNPIFHIYSKCLNRTKWRPLYNLFLEQIPIRYPLWDSELHFFSYRVLPSGKTVFLRGCSFIKPSLMCASRKREESPFRSYRSVLIHTKLMKGHLI